MSWYSQQRPFVTRGNAVSYVFFMTNDTRQSSILSPHRFKNYVDELNILISDSKIGCHNGGKPLINFSDADEKGFLIIHFSYDFALHNFIKQSNLSNKASLYSMYPTHPSCILLQLFASHSYIPCIKKIKRLTLSPSTPLFSHTFLLLSFWLINLYILLIPHLIHGESV